MRRTIFGGSSGRTSCSQDSNPAMKTGVDAEEKPDCPPTEGSDDVSVTNSEVESAMNHRRRRAILQDPGFSEESFNTFTRPMHTSELLEMGLTGPQSSI